MGKKDKLYRFKIIEPFLKKEKKLKEIANDKKISYATLKRWVSAYKKSGVLGLEPKKREDKNVFRKLEDEEIHEIREVYEKTSETNISKLYHKLSKDLKISYSTFYRVINNIDDFFNSSKTKYIGKIKKIHECFLILDIPIYVLVKDDNNKKKVPKLLLMIDVATLEPVDFIVSTKKSNFYTILGFIRNSILKISVKEGKIIMPKEILVSSKEINKLPKLKEIYKSTKIKITEHYTDNQQIQKFIEYLKADMQKYYEFNNHDLSEIEIKKFLTIYLYFYRPQYSFSLNYKIIDSMENIRKLDVFLESASRKVYNSKIRHRNNIYSVSDKFSNGTNITLRFAPHVKSIIYLFSEQDKYLTNAYKIN